MASTNLLYFTLATSTVLFSGGTIFIGRFAKGFGEANLVWAALLLVLANSVYIHLLRQTSFGYAGVISTASNLILLFIASWLIFNEPVRWTKIAALCLAVAAVALYNLPATFQRSA